MANPIAVPGTVVASGSLATPGGAQGTQGIQGPTAVSADTGNIATLGSDSKILVPQSAVVPVGIVVDFAGATAPSGWIICNGSAVSRTTYSNLYMALGGTSSPWGQGDGSTTFNVPDLRGRVSLGVGQGTGLANRVLAANGGEENHALLIGELATHNHTASQGAHTHTDTGHAHVAHNCVINVAGIIPTAGSQAWGVGDAGTAASTAFLTTDSAGAITIGNNGSGTAHNVMQPFVVMNKIIRT